MLLKWSVCTSTNSILVLIINCVVKLTIFQPFMTNLHLTPKPVSNNSTYFENKSLCARYSNIISHNTDKYSYAANVEFSGLCATAQPKAECHCPAVSKWQTHRNTYDLKMLLLAPYHSKFSTIKWNFVM